MPSTTSPLFLLNNIPSKACIFITSGMLLPSVNDYIFFIFYYVYDIKSILILAQPVLFWVSSYMSLWSNILFNCAVLINLIVAFFYPFNDTVPSESSQQII